MCLTRYRIALNGNNNKEAILERGGLPPRMRTTFELRS